MAQHRAARTTHRVRNTMLGIGAFLACMYVIGHNAQQEQAQATPPAPVPTLTATVHPAPVLVTSTAAPSTVQATVEAAPVTITSTSTAAPVTVTSTEYPDHATVTSTAPQQTITEVVHPSAATYAADPATLPHCAQEDGSGRTETCLWDASVDGNGQGTEVLTYTGADQ